MLERISGSLLDPDALYVSNAELFDDPSLRGLNLVMGFTGFADAGHVVKQITAELLDTLESEVVAGYAPSRPMRSDNAPFNAPRAPRPSRGHRPHGKPQAQAPRPHAGPKQHRGGAGNGGNARTGSGRR